MENLTVLKDQRGERGDMLETFEAQYSKTEEMFNKLNLQDLITLKEFHNSSFLKYDYSRNIQTLLDTNLFSKETDKEQAQNIINKFNALALDKNKIEVKIKKPSENETDSDSSDNKNK